MKIFTTHRKLLYCGCYALFFAVFFCGFYFGLRTPMQGWEFHAPLFRYSPDFFVEYFDRGEPFALLKLCNAFLVQFAYYPALGAVIYAALLTLFAFMVNRLARPAATSSERPAPLAWGFAAAALLFPFFPFTFFTAPIFAMTFAAGALLWRATRRTTALHIILRLLYLPAAFLLIKEFAIISCIINTFSDILQPGQKKWKSALGGLGYLSFLLLTILSAWWLWQPYKMFKEGWLFGLISQSGVRPFETPFRFFIPPVLTVICAWISIGMTALSPLLELLYNKLSSNKIRIPCRLALVLAGALAIGFSPAMCRQLTVFYKVDALCRAQKWQQALHVLEKEYPHRTHDEIFTYSTFIYDTQLKTCLLATRKATGSLLTYSRPTFPLLFPNSVTNRPEAYVLPVFYSYIGYYSEALHMGYDWITGRITNPAILHSLLETSLIVDDTLPASKFVYLFKQSLFRGKEAERAFRLQDAQVRERVKRGKALIPTVNYGVNGYSPDMNVVHNITYQPNNPYSVEYFLTLCVLHKDFVTVMLDFQKIKNFYPNGVPRHLQEAYLANFNYVGSRLAYPTRIDGISAEVWKDYWNFILDEQSYQAKLLGFEEFLRKWKHTFWFYDLYMVHKNMESHEDIQQII